MPDASEAAFLDYVVSAANGPRGIRQGDALWVNPDEYNGVQVYATKRGYIAALQAPRDASGSIGRAVSLERTIQP
jgi:hypothetical protein